MKVPPIITTERTCRNCASFIYLKACWKNSNGCGDGLPKFKSKSK